MLEKKKDYKAWIYMAIPLFLLGVFTFYPLIKTVLVSLFTDYNSTANTLGNYISFDAYKFLFMVPKGLEGETPLFVQNLWNTVLVVIISVPVSTAIALLMSVALNAIKPLQKVLQTIFFIPYVTNTLAIGMVFSILFQHTMLGAKPEGLINTIFGLNTDWVGPSATKFNWMFVTLLYIVWNGLPFKVLIFMGGLQSISKQYYDAAKIDSTPSTRVFWKITVPLLSPMISYVLITSFIGAFKTYEAVIAVAGEGAGREINYGRNTVVGYVYTQIGKPGWTLPGTAIANVSYYSIGAAGAIVLFLIIMAITAVNLVISNRTVHY